MKNNYFDSVLNNLKNSFSNSKDNDTKLGDPDFTYDFIKHLDDVSEKDIHGFYIVVRKGKNGKMESKLKVRGLWVDEVVNALKENIERLVKQLKEGGPGIIKP